jgi:hypothetical protein
MIKIGCINTLMCFFGRLGLLLLCVFCFSGCSQSMANESACQRNSTIECGNTSHSVDLSSGVYGR